MKLIKVNLIKRTVLLTILLCFLTYAYASNVLIGQAAWYSKDDPTDPFKHIKNADGSLFDENAYTCAMRSRGFGKYYKITNLSNGLSVIVKHCDFGPALTYKGRKLNRICDLSKAAFTKIADLDEGVIKVKIEKL